MKRLHLLASLAACITLCCCATTSSSISAKRATFPDNAFQAIPQSYFRQAAKSGTVERFDYKTRDNQTEGSKEFEKHALVYLPYGYDANDKTKKYDVLYLMHGWTDSPEWFLQNARLKNVLDNMIADGITRPLIICAVSYYVEYNKDDFTNIKDFHFELDKDIIPVFEKKYNTYAKDTTQKELDATRGHRAFGGFSMGGMTTWYIFEQDLNEFRYFLPISGAYVGKGRGNATEGVKYLTEIVKKFNMTADDFKVYTGCGSNDSAERGVTQLLNEMKKYPETFKPCDNFKDGNIYECVYQGGSHDVNTVMRILYNGLPKMFD